MITLSKQDADRLRDVVKGHETADGFTYHLPMHMSGLEKSGLVQRSPDPAHRDGSKFAYRATPAGIELNSSDVAASDDDKVHIMGNIPENETPALTVTATAPVAETVAAKAKRDRVTREQLGEIKIDTNIPLPPKAAPVTTNEVYPFSTLPVHGSFFLPMAEKLMASAVTAANRRHMPRTFELRAVTENDVAGVRIWRGADLTEVQVAAITKARAERAEKKTATATVPAVAPVAETVTATPE